MKRALALAGALLAGAARAELAITAEMGAAAPTIREIAFEGNQKTQPKVMLREMVVKVGDPADPELVERSRQAVLDLGIFKRVELRQEPLEDGVRLVFIVRERFYVIPFPRLDANSEGQYAYGAQVRWSNLWGLNHNTRILWEQRDRQEKGVGQEQTFAGTYVAPFVMDTRFSLGLGAAYTAQPVERMDGGGEFEEQFTSASFLLSRSLSSGPASQGWSVGGGLLWQDQQTSGALAEPAYGMATALVGSVGYRDLHYLVYSESGVSFGMRVETAVEGAGSDYDYNRMVAGWKKYMQIGETPHQTLHLFADGGALAGGPPDYDAFSLGGASLLRGYDREFVEGDAFYRLAVEYARPIYWRWLRGVVILEAGNAFQDPGDFSLDKVYTSLGLGLRIRLSNFVDFEVEIGWAFPLNGGNARFFASRV
jgi:outer membrane protein assembly factor BamA